MNPRRRLTGEHGTSAEPGRDLHELGVAVEEPRGRVQQVKKGGLVPAILERRQEVGRGTC